MSIDLLPVLAEYNKALWPWQLVAYVLAGYLLYLALFPRAYGARLVVAVLAIFWLWTGVAFFLKHTLSFSPTYYFSGFFILQGGLFLFHAVRPTLVLSCNCRRDPYCLLGMVFVLYALVGYPLVAVAAGRGFPETATFAVTPCPLTVFTFGIFLMTDRSVPVYLFAIPLLWSVAGMVWITQGMIEDVGLVLSGPVATVLLLYRDFVRPEPAGADRPGEIYR